MSELLIIIWVCAGPDFFFFFPNVTKVVSSLVSDLLPLLISNCLHLLFGTQGRSWKLMEVGVYLL